MRCEHYLDLISARLDAPLSPQDEAELTAHLDICPDCRAIARDLEGMHTALTGCVVSAPAELADGVMRTIRCRRAARKRTIRQLGALAACLVLCVGVLRITDAIYSDFTRSTGEQTPMTARIIPDQPLTEGLPFANEQRIRLSDADSGVNPSAVLLNSTDSLANCLDHFPGSDLSALTQSYDEEYFRTHRLLAVVVCEPSSSISRTISLLTEDRATILRSVPEAGDSDQALWLILAEVEGAGPETTLAVELLDN